MNSISELRLLTTGPVGLADPGRLAATAAAPASAAQTAEAAVRTAGPAPEAESDPESRGTRIHRRFARFETLDYADGIPDRDFAFGDLLDVINPLQHIPVVGSLYRNLTGDEISGPAKIMGGLLYGGPIGLVAALATTIAEQEIGRDLGEAALAAVFGDGEVGDLQLAAQAAGAPAAPARVPAQLPALPAADSAAIPAATPTAASAAASTGPRAALDRIDPDPVTITSVEQIHAVDRIAVGDSIQPRSALGGQDALDAFVRDFKGARQAPSAGGTSEDAAIEVVPLPPLASFQARRPPNPQLAENTKIGAIEPGPLGWTIQRRAVPAAPAPPAGAAGVGPLAEATAISGRAFSERMLRALDKYQAMSTLPPRDEDQAPRVDTRL